MCSAEAAVLKEETKKVNLKFILPQIMHVIVDMAGFFFVIFLRKGILFCVLYFSIIIACFWIMIVANNNKIFIHMMENTKNKKYMHIFKVPLYHRNFIEN